MSPVRSSSSDRSAPGSTSSSGTPSAPATSASHVSMSAIASPFLGPNMSRERSFQVPATRSNRGPCRDRHRPSVSPEQPARVPDDVVDVGPEQEGHAPGDGPARNQINVHVAIDDEEVINNIGIVRYEGQVIADRIRTPSDGDQPAALAVVRCCLDLDPA